MSDDKKVFITKITNVNVFDNYTKNSYKANFLKFDAEPNYNDKPFRCFNCQKDILENIWDSTENKKLISQETFESIKNYNFQVIIDGYRDPFLKNNETEHFMPGFNAEDVVSFFNLEKQIKSILNESVFSIETILNTSVCYTIMLVFNLFKLYENKSDFDIRNYLYKYSSSLKNNVCFFRVENNVLTENVSLYKLLKNQKICEHLFIYNQLFRSNKEENIKWLKKIKNTFTETFKKYQQYFLRNDDCVEPLFKKYFDFVKFNAKVNQIFFINNLFEVLKNILKEDKLNNILIDFEIKIKKLNLNQFNLSLDSEVDDIINASNFQQNINQNLKKIDFLLDDLISSDHCLFNILCDLKIDNNFESLLKAFEKNINYSKPKKGEENNYFKSPLSTILTFIENILSQSFVDKQTIKHFISSIFTDKMQKDFEDQIQFVPFYKSFIFFNFSQVINVFDLLSKDIKFFIIKEYWKDFYTSICRILKKEKIDYEKEIIVIEVFRFLIYLAKDFRNSIAHNKRIYKLNSRLENIICDSSFDFIKNSSHYCDFKTVIKCILKTSDVDDELNLNNILEMLKLLNGSKILTNNKKQITINSKIKKLIKNFYASLRKKSKELYLDKYIDNTDIVLKNIKKYYGF